MKANTANVNNSASDKPSGKFFGNKNNFLHTGVGAEDSFFPQRGRPIAQSVFQPLPQPLFQALPQPFPKQRVQPKLTIGSPNDKYEHEADDVANQVMQMHEPEGAQRKIKASIGHMAIQRKCTECEEEESIQRKANEGNSDVPEGVHQVLSSQGATLDKTARDFMEPRFGRDFSKVKIHTNTQAQVSAKSINAKAYASGNNIVFGQNHYNPSSTSGRKLLAHELTHIVQNTPVVQRQEETDTTAPLVELCFAPIRVFHLGDVGGVHAIINIQNQGGSYSHIEVDPHHHQGIEDPAAIAEGAGRVAGLHSHVVVSSGRRSVGNCQTLSVTRTQANQVIASARHYESMDVVYGFPGPNSNSFGEWVLDAAGISTASIVEPRGAIGWGWYQANSAARANPPRVARTFQGTAANCHSPVRRASSFRALIDLVQNAENQLVACGVNDVGERINILRGIFYGTPWSRDFGTSQQSHVRNQMFNVYSGTDQPRNPIECLDCGTFLALGQSQDVEDPRTRRHVDFGHLLIGMDARRSYLARTVNQPVGQVTGLEAATWAGDLGGGAARLSMSRLSASSTPATRYFRGTDYGGSINLEGDVAAYAVGAPSRSSAGDAPVLAISPGGTIASTLENYFFGSEGTPPGWNSRCRVFLTAVGGRFNASGSLNNRADVLAYLSEQIHDFGCWYLVNYQRQHSGMNASRLEQASRHMVGSANEIAEVFLAALERCVANPGRSLSAGSAPPATPIGSSSCLLARAVPEGAALLERGRRTLEEDLLPEVGRQLDRAGRGLEDAGREIEREAQQRRRQFQRWWNN